MKKYLIFLFSIVLFFIAPAFIHASQMSVTPVVVDVKGLPRDIIKQSLSVTNTSPQRLQIYIFVNNVSVKDGQQEFLDPSKADYSSSLANWIDITRGVIVLDPGQSRTVDYKIEIGRNAKPGIYHALVSFAHGNLTRDEAQGNINSGASVMFNAEVLEDIKEVAQLKYFRPAKNFFLKFPASFSFAVENIGNRAIIPDGEVIIYNRQGKEVDSINANSSQTEIKPGETAEIAVAWDKFRALGKYKAVLSLGYGTKQREGLQDTIYFWVIPKPFIIFAGVIFLSLLALAMAISHASHKRKLRQWEEVRAAVTSLPHGEVLRGQSSASQVINNPPTAPPAIIRPQPAASQANPKPTGAKKVAPTGARPASVQPRPRSKVV